MPVDRVVKRDGQAEVFDRRRIENAIYAAARAVGNGSGRQWAETLSWAVTGILEERFGQNGRSPSVEEIQDVVEEVLIKSGHPQVAKAYILYRQKRAEARATERMLMDTEKLVDDYLQKLDWRVNENSNMNYSLQGLNFYLASSIAARYWLHKIYPQEVQRAHSDGDMHIHDLGMLSGYTYYGQEVVVFKDEAGIRLASFEHLYAGCREPEVCLDAADGAFAKYPQDGFVLDRDGWTGVVRLVRKSKNRPMRFIKNRGGRSVIVTDNHPLITRDGEKLAASVHPRLDALYTADLPRLLSGETLFSETEIDLLAELHQAGVTRFGRDRVYFNGVPLVNLDVDQAGGGVIHTPTRTIPRRIPLTAEFGYFVGFVLAEGYLSYDDRTPHTISVTQKDAGALHEVNRALLALGIPGCISQRDGSGRHQLQVKNVFLRFLFEQVLGIRLGARHKSLPVRTLHYGRDFVQGMLAGIIDGHGSAGAGRTSITIRASARTLLEQVACVLHLLGATPRDRNEGVGTSRSYKGREIAPRLPCYGLSFRKTAELVLPSALFQSAALSSSAGQDETRDAWHVVLNNEPTDIPDDEIYDITTESGTLIVNGMWNHNCAGWDLQDLLIQGFGGVPAKIESRPPKHLRTALGQLVNFFYTLQGEVAGAVAVSNFDTLLAPFIRYDKLDYTGIKQAVQEFVYNINVPTRVGFQSLVWDELVLVRRHGRVEPVEIGQLVDEQFEHNHHRVLGQGNGSYAVANADDVQALAFDGEGAVQWVPVKAFVRHRVPQGATFVRVRTSRGTAGISQAHSMFAFEELNGRCTARPIAAHQVAVAHGNARLTPNNHLVAIRRAPNGGTRTLLDLAELIDAVPQLAARVRVRVPDHARAVETLPQRVRRRAGGLTAFYLEQGIKDKGCWQQWADNRSIPYRVWRDLGDDEPAAEFALRNSEPWYARTLAGDRLVEFIRLLGWYITAGRNDISNGLCVSQQRGADQEEMERVPEALGALGRTEQAQGWSRQGNRTSTVLCMAGQGLLAELTGFLAGTYSTTKVIPWFAYDLTHELQETLIATMLRGDGSESPDHSDYTTTSKKLSLGFSLLLAMNGYKFSVYETSCERETWSGQYTVRIYKDRAAAERYEVADLLGRVCMRRDPFAYDREYEYDLSVDAPLENYAGGSGLLCFHNTPFTNITMDLTPPSTLADQAVVISGEPREATYGEFQPEMDLLNRAFAEVMLEGDARGRVFSVDYASYAPVRENGAMRLVRIGEYIDDKMAGASPVRIEDNQAEVLDVRARGIETIGIHDGQVGWHQVHYLVRHPADRLLKITTVGGLNVSVTPSHSVLVLRDGEIVAREAGRLGPGEYLLAPRALDLGQEYVTEISLAQELATGHAMTGYDRRDGGRKVHRVNRGGRDLAGRAHHATARLPIVDSGLGAILEAVQEREPEYRDALNRRYRNSLRRVRAKYGLVGLESATVEKARRVVADAEKMGVTVPQRLKSLLDADLVFLRVKSIEEQRSTTGMVYDFSTASETFLANQILVHNTFPIPTFNVTRDFQWDNPALEPVWTMTAKYGIPYWGNYINSDMNPEDARSMCCRLRLDQRELRKRMGGLFAAAPLTGSAGVATINLPRLGYVARGEADFLQRLERLMEAARTSLEIKRKMLELLTDRGLYPYSRHYLRAVKGQTGAYWSHHFNTIGLIGMNEACLNLLGVGLADPAGKAFAIRTLQFMRDVLTRFQEESGNLYNLEATPAEGASYRLARADKQRFPEIITAGTDKTPYYTNSTHLPVGYSDDLFAVLDHQDELQTLYTGGTVLHIFLGEHLHDWRQARKLVRVVAENYHLPYFTLTPTFSICPVHGYIPGEHMYCPLEHTEEELAKYGTMVGEE